MRCRDVEALLPQYADDVLPPAQRDGVAEHLGSCPDCRQDLSTLAHSLGALSRASREGSPDLWARFQTRVARESSELSCRRAEELLPAYSEGALDPRTLNAVAAHLDCCAACAGQEEALRTSLRTLERGAGAAPDLWQAFSARLAETVRCGDVAEDLPAYSEAALTGARAAAVRSHLEHCASCAGEAVRLDAAMQLLDRVASHPVEVDLWPAFSARLEREREARRPSFADVVRTALAPLAPARGLAPALGVAAAFALAIYGGVAALAPGSDRAFVHVASDTHDDGERNTPKEPRPSAISRDRRIAATTAVEKDARPSRPVLIASAPREADPFTEASRSSDTSSKTTRRIRLVYNPNTDVLTNEPVEQNPQNAQTEVMPELVHVVELLAGVEDASVRPFESSTHVP